MTVSVEATIVFASVVVLALASNQSGQLRSGRRRADELRRESSDAAESRSGETRRAAGRRLPLGTWRAWVMVVGALGALVLLGPFAWLIAVTLVVAAKRSRRVIGARRTRAQIERSAPDAVELFVLLIHAGLTPVQAVEELAFAAPEPTKAGFAAVVHRRARGEPFADALAVLPARLGPSMIGLADAVASADRYGSPLEPVLESLALEARAARRRRNEAHARRLPIRLSFPLVACTLPSFVLLAIAPAVLAALSSISVPL